MLDDGGVQWASEEELETRRNKRQDSDLPIMNHFEEGEVVRQYFVVVMCAGAIWGLNGLFFFRCHSSTCLRYESRRNVVN